MRRATVALHIPCRLWATGVATGERGDTETIMPRSERGDWKRAMVRWYLASRLLNLGHPFEKETSLSFHHPELCLCQVVLSYRRSRGMVLMYKRKQACLGSRSSGKACTGCRRGCQRPLQTRRSELDGPRPPAGCSHTRFRIRLPSGSHGATHP